jgi:ParB/RepB/Spo0J family partition protein
MAIEGKGILGRGNIYRVDPREIRVIGGWNPRTDFTGEEELMNSIAQNGVIEPLMVRKAEDGIVLVDGERRLRATLRAIKAGHNIVSVPALFLEKNINDIEALFFTLIANDGKRLEPVEEAEAFRRFKAWGLSAEEIANRIGRKDVYVKRRLELVNAAPEVKQALKEKKVGVNEARKIVAKGKGSVEKQGQELAKAKQEKAEKPEGRGRLPMAIEHGKKVVERFVAEHKSVFALGGLCDAILIHEGKVLIMVYHEKRHEKMVRKMESDKNTNIIEACMPMSKEDFEKHIVGGADKGINLVVFSVAEEGK